MTLTHSSAGPLDDSSNTILTKDKKDDFVLFMYEIDNPYNLGKVQGVNLGSTEKKTHSISFTTHWDVNTQQVIYEQGGSWRGFNFVIKDGQLLVAVYNTKEENWGFKRLEVDIEGNKTYTASLEIDGQLPADGTASLFLNGEKVDTVEGVGKLYGHSGDIGVGEVAGNTLIDGKSTSKKSAADFKGEIHKVIQSNEVSDDVRSQMEDLVHSDFVPEPVTIKDKMSLFIEDITAPYVYGDSIDVNLRDTEARTHTITFTTDQDVYNQQIIYEEGGSWRGLNFIIQDGQLMVGVYNIRNEKDSWDYQKLAVDVDGNETYTATLIIDGKMPANGTASLYLNGKKVDIVDGIGKLYEHPDDIGIGMLAGKTIIDGQAVSQSGDFKGKIINIGAINALLSDDELAEMEEACGKIIDPVAENDQVSLNEDNSVTMDLLANDKGTGLFITDVDPALNGSVRINNDGTVTYTPDADFNGQDGFFYHIADENGKTSKAFASLTIISVNDNPVAVFDTATVDQGQSVKIDVLANDSDKDGDDLNISDVGNAQNGTIQQNNDGTLTYTPDEGFSGNDSFTYTIFDGQGGRQESTVSINVKSGEPNGDSDGDGINENPKAGKDLFTVKEDETVTLNLTANDYDPDGDIFEIVKVSKYGSATVEINGNGTVNFTPEKDFNGEMQFLYTIKDGGNKGAIGRVIVTVESVNDLPQAGDDFYAVEQGSALTVTLTDNDSDLESDEVSVLSLGVAGNGVLSLNDDGTVTYTPNQGFHGTDTFAYTTVDSDGGTDMATVTVVVNEAGKNAPAVVYDDVFDIKAGGVSKLKILDNDLNTNDIVDIRIDHDIDNANITVDPDGTLSFVSLDPNYEGQQSFTYTLVDKNGLETEGTVDLNISKSKYASGFGAGDHYMLQTDADGWTVIEPGENHRKVYVSGSEDALGINDIARLEGLSPEDINGKWVSKNPEIINKYGNEDTPFDEQMANVVWHQMTRSDNSNWLLLERGYSYNEISFNLTGLSGESPLHPKVVGAYGEGDNPIITSHQKSIKYSQGGYVLRDLTFDDSGVSLLGNRENILLENLRFENEGLTVMNGTDNVTLRRSMILDSHNPTPDDGYADIRDRHQGMFANNVKGLLIEEVYGDHNGWQDGYLTDPTMQPPSIYSHNFYLSSNIRDLTFRENIVSRAASVGTQMRSGAFVENNIYIDNNVGFFVGGGKNVDSSIEDGQQKGNSSLVYGNVVTSAGYRQYLGHNGAYAWSMESQKGENALVDNIVMHRYDPNNPEEVELYANRKGAAVDRGKVPEAFDNTIVYNWDNPNSSTWDTVTNDQYATNLDLITIENYAKDLLNDPEAGIPELLEFLRTRGAENWEEIPGAEEIGDYFRSAFNIDISVRQIAQDITFIPYEHGGGIRWDNALNWSTGDLAGSVAGDSVYLNGNWVNYSGTHYLNNLDFGLQGKLDVGQGYLLVMNDLIAGNGGSELNVRDAGQFWTNGLSNADGLDITVSGGRFGNIGDFKGLFNMDVSGGEVIFGIMDENNFTVGTDSSLTISGDNAKVGFDSIDGGTATLKLIGDSNLTFVTDTLAFSTIREFRSGHFGLDQPDINSVVNLGEGTASLTLDVSNLIADNGVHSIDLIQVDNLIGNAGNLDLLGLGNNGLNGAKFVMDYGADMLSVALAFNDSSINGLVLEMHGSEDSDVFHVIDNNDLTQEIYGFESGDVIDISSLLSGNDDVGDAIAEFVKMESAGDGVTNIMIDADGGANSFKTIASVHHSDLLSDLDDLIDGNQILI